MTDKPYTDADVELVASTFVAEAKKNPVDSATPPWMPQTRYLLGPTEHDIARAVLDALAAAGRLLPDGSETHTEHEIDWTSRYGRAGTETITYWDLDDAQLDREIEAAHLFQSQMLRHRQRTHRKWPDGSTLIGPWITAEEPA